MALPVKDLNDCANEEQRKHVQADMQDAEVQEHGGKDAPDLSLRDQCVDLRTSIHKHTRINVQAATQKRQHQVDGHVDANNDVGHKARILAEHEARAHNLSLHLART